MGGVNLKGKKVKRLRCGCCTAQDFREGELEKTQLKEIKDYVSDRVFEGTRPISAKRIEYLRQKRLEEQK